MTNGQNAHKCRRVRGISLGHIRNRVMTLCAGLAEISPMWVIFTG